MMAAIAGEAALGALGGDDDEETFGGPTLSGSLWLSLALSLDLPVGGGLAATAFCRSIARESTCSSVSQS